jgi:class 3 adenylate cyclase
MEDNTKKPMDSHLEHIRNAAYVLVDDDLRIVVSSAGAGNWIDCESLDIVGQSLLEIFPEFVGSEHLLRQLRGDPDTRFSLPQVYRSSPGGSERYLDLQVERSSKSDGELVVIITDVTEHTQQTQQIQQQRNELKLLSAELHSNNQKMAYIIKRFVPEQEAQKLITAHQLPLPGGEGRSQVTIFFADMRNYTGIAEQLLPEEALQMLNEYLNVVAGAVLNQWGNIVQLVGDMVMAFFDASAPGDDHPLRAIRAALEAHASLKHFSAEHHIVNKIISDAPEFGIGINTGWVVTGYLNAGNRYQYSMIGDTTNIASHLCSQASAGQTIISQSTLDHLEGQVRVNPLGKAHLKRRREPIEIYEMVELAS